MQLPFLVSDLAPSTSIAISVFSMDRIDPLPIASTVIDLFDSNRCLRQGTWNFLLHLDQAPDISQDCKTPGLISVNNCLEINKCLRQLHKMQKSRQETQ